MPMSGTVTTEARVHSVTFYIHKKKVRFYSEALKEISKSIYGSTSATGKVSKYIRSLLDKDLKSRGLLTPEGEPIAAALDNLKSNNTPVATQP
jgi:hypothetical protein